MKRFNLLSQVVLLVACSGVFAFGQARATNNSNNNSAPPAHQEQTANSNSPATGNLTGQQLNTLVSQEATQSVVLYLASELGSPLSGSWSGTVTNSGWSLTFSGSINGQNAALTESGTLTGNDATWTDSGTVGSNQFTGSGKASYSNNEVKWDQSMKSSGEFSQQTYIHYYNTEKITRNIDCNFCVWMISGSKSGPWNGVWGQMYDTRTGFIFSSASLQDLSKPTTIQEGSVNLNTGAISYSSATFAPSQESCSSGNKVPIYSNLGSSNDAFDYTDGWDISGPSSPLGFQQWIGMPFTPTENHTATEIDAAAFYYGNDGQAGNNFNFGIWSDASGVPGTELNGADVANLPTWTGKSGDCCNTQHAAIAPTALTAGTQYWVVLSTDSNGTNSLGVWDYVFNDASGTLAYNMGSSWSTEQATTSAFAVCGSN